MDSYAEQMDLLSEMAHLEGQIRSNVDSLVFEDSGFLHQKPDTATDQSSLVLAKSESGRH